MADNTEIKLQEIIHAELNSDEKENYNFNVLKQAVEVAGAKMQIFQSADLILCTGVINATAVVIDFKGGQYVLGTCHVNNSIAHNKWTDLFYLPAGATSGQNAPELMDDSNNGSSTHVHIMYDAKRRAFTGFIYANESGGTVKDGSYASRGFFVF